MAQMLDHLTDGIDWGVLSQRSLEELREIREQLQEVETGLSFGRRMVQGRLDIVMAEVQRRRDGGRPDDVMERLPDVLAQHTRGGGTPRPVRDHDLPPFTDTLVDEMDRIIGTLDLTSLAEVDSAELGEVVDGLELFERQVSVKRHELHRLIDELQEEIVGRYRSGAASVDDLLR